MAVMIISVVIMALLELFANNTYIFSQLPKQQKINQYSTLVFFNSDYGLESKAITLDMLAKDFRLESDFKKELSSIKAEIIYQTLQQVDMREQKNAEGKVIGTSGMVFEIGKTILRTQEASVGVLRLRIEP